MICCISLEAACNYTHLGVLAMCLEALALALSVGSVSGVGSVGSAFGSVGSVF